MRVLNMLNVQQMLKRKREIAHPRTVDEAKVLLNRAIENGDFEVAEMMHDDLTELQNFEDEMNLDLPAKVQSKEEAPNEGNE